MSEREHADLDRERIAARFDRHARLSALAVLPIGLIAVVDLATGSLTGDRRVDIGLLAAVLLGLIGAYSMHRLAERFRRNDFPSRSTRGLWVRSLASITVSIAFPAVVGYLVGGWPLAIVLVVGVVVLVGGSIGVGLRRRRRLLRGG